MFDAWAGKSLTSSVRAGWASSGIALSMVSLHGLSTVGAGHPGKGCELGTRGSLQLKSFLKMMAAVDCLPTGLPAAEATQSSLKEDDLTFVPNPVPCHSYCLH